MKDASSRLFILVSAAVVAFLLFLLISGATRIQGFFGGAVPLVTIVSWIVILVTFLVTIYLSILHKSTWRQHVVMLIALCVGGYFYAQHRGWGWPYWGVLIGILASAFLLFVDVRVRALAKNTKKNSNKPGKSRTDNLSAKIELDEPGGRGRTGLIDLAHLFSRVDEDVDIERMKTLNQALGSVTAFLGQLLGLRDAKLLDDKQFHAALKRLGLSHLFEVDKEPEEERSGMILADLDDNPRM